MDEHQYIFGTSANELKETKEVKMRIPISHLIRLHGLKLLSGQNISETVTKALEVYFAKTDAEKEAKQAHEASQDAASQTAQETTSETPAH